MKKNIILPLLILLTATLFGFFIYSVITSNTPEIEDKNILLDHAEKAESEEIDKSEKTSNIMTIDYSEARTLNHTETPDGKGSH